eukprot:298797-Chlamydomonas_euryale.AAC.2
MGKGGRSERGRGDGSLPGRRVARVFIPEPMPGTSKGVESPGWGARAVHTAPSTPRPAPAPAARPDFARPTCAHCLRLSCELHQRSEPDNGSYDQWSLPLPYQREREREIPVLVWQQ